jgi:RNA polymerase sigma factor (sigma-70 family)
MFETTLWSRIQDAQRGDSSAAHTLVNRYRSPLVAYFRSKRLSPEDAEDLAQEVLLRLFAQGSLARADKERGRFRAYLLGVGRNVWREHCEHASAKKRGGAAQHVPLSDAPEIQAAEPDEGFDRIWAEQLLARALEELEGENPRQHKTLLLRFQKGASPAAIAEELGRNAQQVSNDMHRARKRLVALVKAEIAGYASSKEEYDDDLRLFMSRVGLGSV